MESQQNVHCLIFLTSLPIVNQDANIYCSIQNVQYEFVLRIGEMLQFFLEKELYCVFKKIIMFVYCNQHFFMYI